jgi:hypothetical protein
MSLKQYRKRYWHSVLQSFTEVTGKEKKMRENLKKKPTCFSLQSQTWEEIQQKQRCDRGGSNFKKK